MRSTSIGGLVILAVLIVGVAVWMYFQRPQLAPMDEADSVPVASPEVLTGFRSDAWFLPDDDLLGFVEIPAGPFLMGSDPAIDPLAFENERWTPEQSQETVDIPSFYISRYEVTVAQFNAFVEATGFKVDTQALQDHLRRRELP